MNLPLIGSPLPASIIVLTYFLLVFKIGPDFMECRKPYNVRSAMLKYNIAQIAMNLLIFVAVSPNILSNFYIFIISLFQAYYYIFVKKLYDFRCMEKLPLDHPNKNMERWLVYLYFLNKVLDLADTLFFVLRKSYKQITVLHVYHHALMVVGVAGTYYFYGPGGQYSMTGIINSLVHVFMYGYYFAAALLPEVKNQLWLKKSVTQLQFLQFMILFLQAPLTLWLSPGCAFPKLSQYLQMLVCTSMMVMFGNFYYRTYVKAKSKTN